MKDDPLLSYRRKPATFGKEDIDALETFAETLRTRVAKGKAYHCRITNDDELRALNSQFRGNEYPTDVLSFPLDGDPDSLGDIAISLNRARAQAKQYGHGPLDEIRILLLHGLLHLRGMDHETDAGQMARTETAWRKKLGLPNSLIARVSAGESA